MNTQHTGDFETSARAVIAFLHRRLGFNLWMVTRVEGDDWIVLQSEDHGYGIEPGMVFRWADSFCSEMVKGNGPRIAPRSQDFPAYAKAPFATKVHIESYVGLPLRLRDGRLFGTLCAIDPAPQPESITGESDLIELLGGMLSSVLQAEIKASEDSRLAERLQMEVMTDALTGLYNRRGWESLLASEEDRCRRFGHPTAILVVGVNTAQGISDLTGLAVEDAVLTSAGAVLRTAARSSDIIARLDEDEFGILGPCCNGVGGQSLLERARAAMSVANIDASIGLAVRDPLKGLENTWNSAAQLMHAKKRSA
jgi:diguanylate cyclase